MWICRLRAVDRTPGEIVSDTHAGPRVSRNEPFRIVGVLAADLIAYAPLYQSPLNSL